MQSYDVIELVSNFFARRRGVFIPVSIDANTIKINQEMQDL